MTTENSIQRIKKTTSAIQLPDTSQANQPEALPVTQAMTGDISEKPPAYLLKIASYYEATGHLEVGSGAFKVVIQFGLGKPVFAASPIYKGDEAILDLFTWTSGQLNFINGQQPQSVNVQDSWEHLAERGRLFSECARFLEENAISENSILTRSIKVSSDQLLQIVRLAQFYKPQKLIDAYSNIYGTLNLIDVAERSGLTRSDWILAAAQLLQLGLLLTPDGRNLKLAQYEYSALLEQAQVPTYKVGVKKEQIFDESTLLESLQAHTNKQTKALDCNLFLYMIAHEFARAPRFNTNLTLAIISIKVDNANDQIPLNDLCSFLRAIEQVKREVDTLGHIGNHSFGLLLPSVNVPQAVVLVDRINQNIDKIAPNFARYKASVHFGLASAPDDATTISAVCEIAEKRLFEAAAKGLHRI